MLSCPLLRKYNGEEMPPTITVVPLNSVGSGRVPGDTVVLARFWPYTAATVPGATLPPAAGLVLFTVPLSNRIGGARALAFTPPPSFVVDDCRVPDDAANVMVTLAEGNCGVQSTLKLPLSW